MWCSRPDLNISSLLLQVPPLLLRSLSVNCCSRKALRWLRLLPENNLRLCVYSHKHTLMSLPNPRLNGSRYPDIFRSLGCCLGLLASRITLHLTLVDRSRLLSAVRRLRQFQHKVHWRHHVAERMSGGVHVPPCVQTPHLHLACLIFWQLRLGLIYDATLQKNATFERLCTPINTLWNKEQSCCCRFHSKILVQSHSQFFFTVLEVLPVTVYIYCHNEKEVHPVLMKRGKALCENPRLLLGQWVSIKTHWLLTLLTA